MTKRMLIDATHAEETRVVVLDGNRLEDFDVETSGKKQLKGNIYLAKIVRVEPSLQAAFVEYGGNRHGFLAFGEIHPDYYQIPVADRQRLIALQAEAARAEQAAEEALDAALTAPMQDAKASAIQPPVPSQAEIPPWESAANGSYAMDAEVPAEPTDREPGIADAEPTLATEPMTEAREAEPVQSPEPMSENAQAEPLNLVETGAANETRIETFAPEPPPQTVGGEPDAADDSRERRIPMQYLRNYKIQEVIRRRQILLVQVVKEERGTKGAALTTYISLAGRFSVLMPNSPRGGGISRKITSAADRRRLKEITAELEIPDGMGMIVRTAGANRPKPEIKRDCEYLLRLWDEVRETTLRSVAPALIHEEASLIKRAIRDVYSRDIEEILVDGEEGWRAARDFMRMLMPSHAQKVIAWRDPTQPLFAKHAVEAQLDAMMGKNVQLRSGGYLVIDQTEALVSIDVNSGRSTRERGIEETALRTNLEAADEVARQLRLRDLAGLIVIDFIDMESKKHNSMVERRLQEALKADRARIQVGTISHFGLMEMSRQRLRPSLMEASLVPCPHCSGSGHVRSTESAAIHILRGIEDDGARRRNAEIMVHVAGTIAMYILNHKRERLRTIEVRYGLRVLFNADPTLIPPQMRIEKLRTLEPSELPPSNDDVPAYANGAAFNDAAEPASVLEAPFVPQVSIAEPEGAPAFETAEAPEAVAAEADTAEARAEEESRRRRRRRRRGPRRDDTSDGLSPVAALGAEQPDLNAPPPLGDNFPAVQMEIALAPAPLTPPSDPLPAEAAPIAFTHTDIAAPEPVMAEPSVVDPVPMTTEITEPVASETAPAETEAAAEEVASITTDEEGDAKPRRRGRRGGRRRRRDEGDEVPVEAAEAGPAPVMPPAYDGPTPADPFGRQPFDIFDVMDQVEQAHLSPAPEPAPPADVAVSPQAASHVESAPAVEPPVTPVPNGLHLVETIPSPPAPVEPLVKPVLINAPAQDRKRGWWRR